MMIEEEDVFDPESVLQFSEVLKEMQGIFHRKVDVEEDTVGKQEVLESVKSLGTKISEFDDNLDVFLTASSSWSDPSSGEAPVILQGDDESVITGNHNYQDKHVKGEFESGRLLEGNVHQLYDEDGETGYHSMTTTSSDSSSLDSISPSPTTTVGNVRALTSSNHFPSNATTNNSTPLLHLPDKLLVAHLLPLLGPRDLVRLSASCRRLQRLCWSILSTSSPAHTQKSSMS